MKLTVKTLKGAKFDLEVEESLTVAQVKTRIEEQKSELPAACQKLIHSGKVLKDEDTIGSCNIKENDFLVVMVTKPKKAADAPAAAPAAPAVDTKVPAVPPPAAAASAPTPVAAAAAAPASTTASTPAPSTTTSTPPAAPAAPTLSEEAVSNLVAMGFPEAEVRHCLRAAHGNPDVAVEFLTNGIPDGMMEASGIVQAASTASSATSASTSSSSTNQPPLQALRNHPQFDALRRLVQNNPGMLSQVLTQIGQQQPDLLREINENQSEFLRLMNEPITESSSTSAPAASAASGASRDAATADEMDDMMGMNPMRMAQIIPTMNEEELSQLAQMMGLTPEQLRQTAQILSQMPEGQMHQFMGEMEAMREAFGEGGGGGGPQVLRLTEEEMAAVNRLTEMGFDRSEAAQAFLACDKNEALAANLLMDSMGDGGGGFFGGGGSDDHQNDGNGGGDGNDNDDDDDDDENMYD